ncbi:chemotaxis protein CheX [Anoxybacillus sp. LAT_35]|uniref:chemotaxis protein CheX n=1 Tax=Anoxybacillus TaxID=150247 RepID=UPI001EDBE06D|nr:MULTISPECIES: chemotaxis protein CheX [Anoxybacillus]MCG5026546.1 chemotaxis protein CheX [Anoxybacillus flavithermus]MCG6199300.1 chemotaxis protein CheX [Anoxybacillus sp. LAT_38]MCG3083063.1 chemotaxis protein CheX [Anoxybacillus sp. LAT27]MCG6171188.1 chemotaxis protein CheX [Anoxybacillus sp. LAT_11]MCG6176299.1 chemotaxis protein CheX [Anoxybacillus sp. LAT_31]
MALGEKITTILNGTIESIRSVIPLAMTIEKPSLFTQPFTQASISVLIGMTGDLRGRLMIEGHETMFGSIGETMFGMPLEGEMLESFTGELGNMIAGNLATIVFQKGITIDITPPTVLVGQTKIYGFDKAFRVPIHFENKGELQLILTIDNE